ncbi:hypothetical protein LPJ53_000833 [Coemansia erecta]|uniref:Acetyl-CoA synthetase-like protein n=1 Tax=Coemansia erecta TaxID=147472 RepID=A0A9W7Y189_9FUNG|nr:hypothetical protein LPJ53_000833 [Coemansia erecta]
MIFPSTLPPITTPDSNLVTYVFTQSAQHAMPTHPVFVDSLSSSMLTLQDLQQKTLQLAHGLHTRLGIQRGDTVAIFAANSIYYPLAAYAIVALGAVCSPANPQYTPRELAHQLESSGCSLVVVGDGMRDKVEEALRLCGRSGFVQVLMMDEGRRGGEQSMFSYMREDAVYEILPREGGYLRTPAYLCYSSGTTGRPKGVLLTHGNMIANAQQINQIKTLDSRQGQGQGQGERRSEVFLGLAPFCHAYGLSYVLHSSVALGGTIVVMARYSFAHFLRAVERHRITYGYLVPPIICALSKDPLVDQHDLSSMRTVLSGGATLSAKLIEAAQQRLPGMRVLQGYGMSEMSPAMTMLATSHDNPASIGILMPSCDAKVLDADTDQPLAGPGQTGELCFRGPNVMLGYLANPQATRELIDSDGFVHTGDIGHIDAQGFFYITDRKKEIIKYKGFQVAPSELEGMLAEHPDVEDAAVMPVYDDAQATEMPRAYIVLREGGEGGREERAGKVVAWINARVAAYKKLRGGYVLVDSIPRSPAGKIIRASLRNIEHVDAGSATSGSGRGSSSSSGSGSSGGSEPPAPTASVSSVA